MKDFNLYMKHTNSRMRINYKNVNMEILNCQYPV